MTTANASPFPRERKLILGLLLILAAASWALLICSLIEVQGHRPVAISHRPRCACDQCNIQAIKGYAAIVPPINVESKGDLTRAGCRLRS